MFFASRAGQHGHVVAFEPHPRNYERILEHLALNRISNVTVCNIGIGRSKGDLRLMAGTAGLGRATADEALQRRLLSTGAEAHSVTVPVNSLDDAISGLHLPDPDFVKIDVEGLEVDVIEGMQATIARCRPELLVEIHGADMDTKQSKARRAVELLTARGYALRHIESDRDVGVNTYERAVRGHLYAH